MNIANLIEHAHKVLAEIDAALALAEKATKWPWEADTLSESFVWPEGCDNGYGEFIKVYTLKSRHDCVFIAASRTLLPASLRCLKTAIEGLLIQLPNSLYIGNGNATALLTALLEQWEAGKH